MEWTKSIRSDVAFTSERRRGGKRRAGGERDRRGVLVKEFWVQAGPWADFEGVWGHIRVVVEEV